MPAFLFALAPIIGRVKFLAPFARALSVVAFALIAVALVLALWFGAVWGYHAIQRSDNEAVDKAARAEVQGKWDADKIEWARKLAAKAAEYRAAESTMRAAADALNAEGKAREARLAADLRLALDQLRRDRNARPGGVGGNPGPAAVAADGRPGTCDGRGLYADDAAVLVRLAAQLERERGHLRQCVRQYNAARDALMPKRKE